MEPVSVFCMLLVFFAPVCLSDDHSNVAPPSLELRKFRISSKTLRGKARVTEVYKGWNNNIKWQKLDDALAGSAETKKPVMLVIHKSWCGACKALKPRFADSEEIEELSSNFHMVNTIDDDEPKDKMYSPDGGIYHGYCLYMKEK